MDKFNLKEKDIQWLEITDRELIENFYEYNIDFWRQDIHRFDEYMKNINVDIIKKLLFFLGILLVKVISLR